MVQTDNYKIREITPADNSAMAAIVRKNLENHGLDIPGTAYFDSTLDSLSDFYINKNNRGYYILVDHNNTVVGGIGFAEIQFFSDCAELQKIYLDDSVKGLGLGYMLIDFAEQKIIESGYKAVYLETHSNLRAAMHLYEKCGYSKIDRPEQAVHGAMTDFYYKKLL